MARYRARMLATQRPDSAQRDAQQQTQNVETQSGAVCVFRCAAYESFGSPTGTARDCCHRRYPSALAACCCLSTSTTAVVSSGDVGWCSGSTSPAAVALVNDQGRAARRDLEQCHTYMWYPATSHCFVLNVDRRIGFRRGILTLRVFYVGMNTVWNQLHGQQHDGLHDGSWLPHLCIRCTSKLLQRLLVAEREREREELWSYGHFVFTHPAVAHLCSFAVLQYTNRLSLPDSNHRFLSQALRSGRGERAGLP